MKQKKIAIDLFSGTGSATKAFEKSDDWIVFKVDIDKNKEADLHKDVMDVEASELPDADFVWASPPCKAFSVASIGHHWEKNDDDYIPETDFAQESIELVKHGLSKKVFESVN